MAKLTKAQRALLQDCVRDGLRGMTGVVSYYTPAKMLVSKGLAEWLNGDPFSERLLITKAGRAALQQEPKP